jgi:hypothetical protein
LSQKSDMPAPQDRLPFSVDGFERLRRPVWIFDDASKRKVYANPVALALWGAANLEELLARDFTDQSAAVRIRMDAINARIVLGETVNDTWTFYPNGEPVAVRTAISLIQLVDGAPGLPDPRREFRPSVRRRRGGRAVVADGAGQRARLRLLPACDDHGRALAQRRRPPGA